MWSDGYRSRRGRRIPFLFWSTPCAVIALVLIGYGRGIGAGVYTTFAGSALEDLRAAVTLAALCVS